MEHASRFRLGGGVVMLLSLMVCGVVGGATILYVALGYASEGLVMLSFVVCGVVESATSRASFRESPAGVTVSP